MPKRDAAPALPYLLGIPIKDFTVIASGDNKTGAIAQNLLDKYPEPVHMDEGGIIGLQYKCLQAGRISLTGLPG